MEQVDILLLVFGIIIILSKFFAIIKPRLFVEWTERQFVFHRVRLIVGFFMLLIGGVSAYYLLKELSKIAYLLSFLSLIFLLLGVLILSFPDLLRKSILTIAEKEDKELRIMAGIAVLIGVIMVLVAVI